MGLVISKVPKPKMHLLTITTTLLLSFAEAAPTSSGNALSPRKVFQHPAPLNFIANTLSSSATTSDDAEVMERDLEKRTVGGVRLSSGPNFTGQVWYGVYPLNQCIGLGSYTGNVLSFRPDEGTECLLMQGECNGEADYADLTYNSTHVEDLSYYDFAKFLESYMCYTEDP